MPEKSIGYEKLEADFYESQKNSRNPIRAWFHKRRHKILGSLVDKYYSEGMAIVDLGCGSCEWNTKKLPVTGVDANKGMLKYAEIKGNLMSCVISDLDKLGFRSNSIDMIVISEVLEHVEYGKVIKEVNRILKLNGIVISTVPFDTRLSLWKPLFFIQCLLQSYAFGDEYYKSKCGHINSFSPRKFKNVFESAGFCVLEQFNMRRFTIFMVAKKINVGKNYSDLTVVIPTLNEVSNIGKLINYIIRNYEGVRVIVCDDGSRDGTQEIVKMWKRFGLELLDRSNRNPHGLTASVLDGIEMVESPYFVVMDGDGQHPPEKIREMVRLLRGGYELVVECRSEVLEWGWYRKVISWVADKLGKVSLFIRGKPRCRDILSGYFGGQTEVAKEVIVKGRFEMEGYKVLFDLLKASPKDMKIAEGEYVFQTREGGKSKMGWEIIWRFLRAVLR